MVLVKILGVLDLIGAIIYLVQVFGIKVPYMAVLFIALLLFLKGLFVLKGEFVLSFIDLFAGIFLILSILFSLPIFILWIMSFLMIAKGVVSFM